jgi:hypothetical protein
MVIARHAMNVIPAQMVDTIPAYGPIKENVSKIFPIWLYKLFKH